MFFYLFFYEGIRTTVPQFFNSKIIKQSKFLVDKEVVGHLENLFKNQKTYVIRCHIFYPQPYQSKMGKELHSFKPGVTMHAQKNIKYVCFLSFLIFLSFNF